MPTSFPSPVRLTPAGRDVLWQRTSTPCTVLLRSSVSSTLDTCREKCREFRHSVTGSQSQNVELFCLQSGTDGSIRTRLWHGCCMFHDQGESMSTSTPLHVPPLPTLPSQPFRLDVPLHNLLQKDPSPHWRGRSTRPEHRLLCPRRSSRSIPRCCTRSTRPTSPHTRPFSRLGSGTGPLPRS